MSTKKKDGAAVLDDEKANIVAPELTRMETDASAGPPYSVFTKGQKHFIIFMASWAGFFSPVSANIYFPALNVLAKDLKVSNSLINLTLTSYMIFQGLAPSFIGPIADSMGRRPAYTICFVIYIVANIGLALQNSYAALFVLRCLQSTGSSATIAMASAVVADVATPSERGSYMGYVLAGSLTGPALGPVIGGLLAQFLGWRSIFWFLTLFAGAFLVVFLIFFPETARGTVGNGSIPPQGWNMSLMNYLAVRKARKSSVSNMEDSADLGKTFDTKKRSANPLASLKVIGDKQTATLLIYNAFLFAAFYDVTAVIPSQFQTIYGFNDLQIGLSYIPFGFGSLIATFVNGHVLDWNFARWCRKEGVQIRKGRDQDLRSFPIEHARLEIALPMMYASIGMVIIFGWVLQAEVKLAAILVVLFLTSFTMCIAFNVTSTLLVDFYPKSPATATAANNLMRCLLGAAATGLVVPMIEGMGRGWTFTFLALVLLVSSPLVWINLKKGQKWREQRRLKAEHGQTPKDEEKDTQVESTSSTKMMDPVKSIASTESKRDDEQDQQFGKPSSILQRVKSHDHHH